MGMYWCAVFLFCKQKTAYDMRISDWSSDVCSSDLMSDRLERGDFSGLLQADEATPLIAPLAAVSTGLWDPELFWRPDEDSEREVGLKRETARVPVEALDRMLNEAGEISISLSRLEEHNSGIEAQLAAMAQAVARVREQLRQMDIQTDAQIAARGLTQASAADRSAGECADRTSNTSNSS